MESAESYELDINPKKVCRLCLSQPSTLVNIYSTSIVDGYIISVPDMLAFTVDITVSNDDKLPSKICVECKKQIITFYTFKQKTKRTEQSLMAMFGVEPATNSDSEIVCGQCDMVFETESDFIDHAQTRHPGAALEFESVPAKQSSKDHPIELIEFDTLNENSNDSIINTEDVSITEDDLMAVEEDDSEDYHPPQAKRLRSGAMDKAQKTTPVKKENESGRALRSRASTSKKIAITKTEQSDVEAEFTDDTYDEEYVPANDDTVSEQCTSCGEPFESVEQMLEHECELMMSESGENTDLICYQCNKRMRSSAQLHQHNKMHDSRHLIISYTDFFPCHDCKLVFIEREKRTEHYETVHPGKTKDDELSASSLKNIDESCIDYQFLDEEDKILESKDEPYACGNCGLSFDTVNDLKQHVLHHSSKFSCPMYDCGCQYDQLSRLTIHVLNKHINTKNLQCLHCGLAFQTYDHLQAHLKNSCKEKKFKCYECDKKFFSKKALITHIRTLKMKRYKCEFCEKTFKQQGELTIHTRSHTNERPFQCTICNKSYKTSSMRAAHMDSHIEGKTFECTMCDKKLQSRTSYRNHMKRHTDEKKHECEYCGKKFFTRYHLKLHQSKMHKMEISNNAEVEEQEIMEDEVSLLIYE